MAVYKNVAGQKMAVYAYDPTTASGTDPSKTGDAANITAQISLDGGTSAATNDVTPTELDAVDHPGVYIFDFTQAESNADMVMLSAVSATANILLDPVQIFTIPGSNAAITSTLTATALDLIASTSTGFVSIAKAVWDRVLTGATHNIATSAGRRLRGIQEFQGYEGGMVWINTLAGTAGTVDYENGTVENEVDTMADANTIAASLGFSAFHISPGSSITLGAAQNNQLFAGANWTLALNTQDIAGTMFHQAAVSGVVTGTGTRQMYRDCMMGATSHIKNTSFESCRFSGTQTVIEAGDYFITDGASAIAGTSTWPWDFGAVGATNLSVGGHKNGMQINNMTSLDTMSLSGQGQLIIDATCTGGTIARRGEWQITDNSGGAVTIVSDDNTAGIAGIATTLGAAGAGLTDLGGMSTGMKAEVRAEDAAALATFWTSPATLIDLFWDEVIDKAAHDVPNSGAKYLRLVKQSSVSAEGSVSGGTPTTTNFNTTLTDADGLWNDSLIVFTSGALEGQAIPISVYLNANGNIDTNGEEFIAAPADGDEFQIKPSHVHPIDQIAQGVWDFDTDNTAAGATLAGNVLVGTLKPTIAGRTIDLTTGGNAGIDWGNVVSQSSAVDLSGTTVGTVNAIKASAITAIATEIFTFDVADVEATAGPDTLTKIVLMAGHSDTTTNAGFITVFRTNGITEFEQITIITSASAELITEIS